MRSRILMILKWEQLILLMIFSFTYPGIPVYFMIISFQFPNICSFPFWCQVFFFFFFSDSRTVVLQSQKHFRNHAKILLDFAQCWTFALLAQMR